MRSNDADASVYRFWLPRTNGRNVPRLSSFASRSPPGSRSCLPLWTLPRPRDGQSVHTLTNDSRHSRHCHVALFLAACWRMQPASCTLVAPSALPSGAYRQLGHVEGVKKDVRREIEDGQEGSIRTTYESSVNLTILCISR